ncbi:S49 family peptidase [Litoribacillus peritrichatus]|uniref:Signal peptide peptidase SppA n=1 Tax=Litoribacillus peritrichatus TaxID=718191 RepID=A0ABP7N3C6_9GAMM
MTEQQGSNGVQENNTRDALREASSSGAGSKEWHLIEKMVLTMALEQRKARRWGIFRFLISIGFMFFVFSMILQTAKIDRNAVVGEGEYTALVEVKGPIMADGEASADVLVTGLREAFESPGTKGVVLRINSPGGSPVQSGYVNDEIKRLKGLYPEIPVYAVISDLGASGAYYIAVAADKIFADKASLVGSVGVTASSFGFVDTIEKLGVERRTFTAGEHKGFLDPFLPVKEDEKVFWESVLKTTHQQFISVVKEGRGDKLADNPDLFSGLVWSGEQALELGLVDELGSSSYVAREVVGAEKIVDFTPKPDPFKEFTKRLGTSMAMYFSKALGIEGPVLR